MSRSSPLHPNQWHRHMHMCKTGMHGAPGAGIRGDTVHERGRDHGEFSTGICLSCKFVVLLLWQ